LTVILTFLIPEVLDSNLLNILTAGKVAPLCIATSLTEDICK